MRRWAIWATNAVLFTLGCFLLARIAVTILAEVALPERAEMTPTRVQTRAAERTWADRKVITERNIFGAKLAVDEVVVIPDESLEAAETKLPLELLGTIAGSDPSVSNAAIQDVGTRQHQVVFVGDFLDNHPRVEVHSIAREVVFLKRNDGRLEKLVLKEDGKGKGGMRPGRARRGRRAANTRSRPAPPERTFSKRIERLQKQGGRSTATLYSQARIVPKWDEGQMVGVQLNQVKEGSLYEKIGIRSGDVITSLNGITIDSPQASSKLLTEFTNAKEFNVLMLDGREIKVNASELVELPGDSQ
ncbi:MAG: type II secretion system protein N [Myxococcota bacterium]|nr:type II secretion system protein N [Myxococcota bacterium]